MTINGHRLTVLRADPTRIRRIRIEPVESPEMDRKKMRWKRPRMRRGAIGVPELPRSREAPTGETLLRVADLSYNYCVHDQPAGGERIPSRACTPTCAEEEQQSHAGFPVHHVLQRHALSPDGQGRGAPARAARAHGRVPDGPDLLRADALQHRLPARGDPAGAALRRGLRRCRGGRLAVGLVRGDGARDVPEGRGLAGDELPARAVES